METYRMPLVSTFEGTFETKKRFKMQQTGWELEIDLFSKLEYKDP